MKKEIYDYFWVFGSVISIIMFCLLGVCETVSYFSHFKYIGPPSVHFLVYHIYCQLMVKRVF